MTIVELIIPLPSIEEINAAYSYDPDAGTFTNVKTGKTFSKRNYVRLRIDGIYYLAHRIAWKLMTGSDPVNIIDHINDDPSDNRFCNLQDITEQENSAKAHFKNYPVKPPYHKGGNNTGWMADAQMFGLKKYIGQFPTREEACAAIDVWRVEQMEEFDELFA